MRVSVCVMWMHVSVFDFVHRPTKAIKKYFLRIFIYIIDIKEAEPIPNRSHTLAIIHTHTDASVYVVRRTQFMSVRIESEWCVRVSDT